MALSSDLISQFAKVTKDETETKKESIVYGTAVEYGGKMYARLDGSDRLTPIVSTAGVKAGDRVTVIIKNHSAILSGNVSSPSASKDDVDGVQDQVDEIGNQISEFEIIIADKVSTDELEAERARIDQLIAEDVIIKGSLDAANAKITNLEAENVTITGDLKAANAEIENLKTTKLDAEIAEITYATIENLEATNAKFYNLEADYGEFKDLATEKFTAIDADIKNLDTEKLSAEDADIKYANIDFANIGKAAIENFFSKSGMIGDLVVGDGTITGTLVGVTIKGDLIEGGTVVADKLVIKGDDGLYYKLNTDGETVGSKQTDYNSLNGSIITAKSVTAEKISVNDLVAFGATIGGFHITDDSIYSGVKESVNNTTRGSYMDDDGQFAIGDGTNFLKFFQDTDGSYKLVISASQITLGTKNLVSSDDVQEIVDNLEIGGTNLLRNSNFKYDFTYWVENYPGGCAQILESQYDYIGKFVQLTQEQVYPNANDVCRFYANPITNFTHTAGETYTLSFYGAIINSDIDSVGIIAAIAGDGQRIGRFKVSEANTWTLFTATYTATIAGSLTFHSDVEGAIFQLANIKLEKGNKATDWSPSPKDIESDLEHNYYTKTEVDSKIEITQDGITSSVKEEVSKIQIGGTNLIINSINYTKDSKFHISEKGGDSQIQPNELPIKASIESGKTYIFQAETDGVWSESHTIAQEGTHIYLYLQTQETVDAGNPNAFDAAIDLTKKSNYVAEPISVGTTGKGIWKLTIPTTKDYVNMRFRIDVHGDSATTYDLNYWNFKLEEGNKPTDWSPAPEDMATGEEVENAQAAADEANATADSTESRVTVAETTIQQLSDSISQLVTDENGNSLMTQTSDGWTFNMGAINSSLNDAKETLSNLSGSVAGIDSTVDKLDSLVDDLAKKTAYIVMTTDDTGAPCIELGKSDNPFKVRITNTSVDFLEGSIRIAYISNKALYIERAIVKDELQIGEGKGFVWKRRSNGNMGLRWVGG